MQQLRFFNYTPDHTCTADSVGSGGTATPAPGPVVMHDLVMSMQSCRCNAVTLFPLRQPLTGPLLKCFFERRRALPACPRRRSHIRVPDLASRVMHPFARQAAAGQPAAGALCGEGRSGLPACVCGPRLPPEPGLQGACHHHIAFPRSAYASLMHELCRIR